MWVVRGKGEMALEGRDRASDMKNVDIRAMSANCPFEVYSQRATIQESGRTDAESDEHNGS